MARGGNGRAGFRTAAPSRVAGIVRRLALMCGLSMKKDDLSPNTGEKFMFFRFAIPATQKGVGLWKKGLRQEGMFACQWPARSALAILREVAPWSDGRSRKEVGSIPAGSSRRSGRGSVPGLAGRRNREEQTRQSGIVSRPRCQRSRLLPEPGAGLATAAGLRRGSLARPVADV